MVKSTLEIFKYAWKKREVTFIISSVTLLVIIFVLWKFEPEKLKLTWDHFADWPIAILTLLVALSVFFSELREDWRESRPKKLTVVFTHKGEEVMRCNHAPLSSEADLRALSQQIGRQMADAGDLKFKPMLDKVGKELSNNKKEMLYEVSISLTRFDQGYLKDVFDRGEKLVWDEPFLEKAKEVQRNGSKEHQS